MISISFIKKKLKVDELNSSRKYSYYFDDFLEGL